MNEHVSHQLHHQLSSQGLYLPCFRNWARFSLPTRSALARYSVTPKATAGVSASRGTYLELLGGRPSYEHTTDIDASDSRLETSVRKLFESSTTLPSRSQAAKSISSRSVTRTRTSRRCSSSRPRRDVSSALLSMKSVSLKLVVDRQSDISVCLLNRPTLRTSSRCSCNRARKCPLSWPLDS